MNGPVANRLRRCTREALTSIAVVDNGRPNRPAYVLGKRVWQSLPARRRGKLSDAALTALIRDEMLRLTKPREQATAVRHIETPPRTPGVPASTQPDDDRKRARRLALKTAQRNRRLRTKGTPRVDLGARQAVRWREWRLTWVPNEALRHGGSREWVR